MANTGKGVPMTRDLESKIICGTFGPGEKIPSLRKLMEKYGVSINTARRSVKSLVDKGLLAFVHGSGTFVAEHRSPARQRRRIAAIGATFGLNELNTCTGIAVNGLLDAARDLNLDATLIRMNFQEMSDSRLEALSAGFDGVILLGGYDGILESPRLGVAAVGLSMHNSCDGLFSLIELDPFRATELAVSFFRSRNVKHVMLVGHPRPVHRLREQLFLDSWNRYGSVICTPDDHVAEFRAGYGVYYTCGFSALTAAAEYQLHTGRELALDYPVLSVDGNPMFVDHPCRTLPTIAINLRLAGAAAAEECLRRIEHPGTAARRIYINAELYSGSRN